MCPGIGRAGLNWPGFVGGSDASSVWWCWSHTILQMQVDELRTMALEFEPELQERKLRLAPKETWYPFSTMNNFHTFESMLTGSHRDMSQYLRLGAVADIGAADGDLAFLFDSLGYDVDIIDNGPTNFNGLLGARLLAEDLGSRVAVHEIDLDSQFALPRTYGVAFFLGILYHLQNPFYALQRLSMSTRYAFISTRVAQVTVDQGVRLSEAPVAYLLGADECNNDATNFWIFSEQGFRRLLDRTGWDVLAYEAGGCTVDSDPSSMDRDERAFCLVRSRAA